MKKDKGNKPKEPIRRIRLQDEEEEEVGYGKPPKAYRFRPGQSGNPTGRPKGVKNEMTIMRELLSQKITINVRGRVKRITLLEALHRRAVDEGLRGDLKCIAFILNRFRGLAEGQSPTDEPNQDDKAVLDTFIARLMREADDGNAQY